MSQSVGQELTPQVSNAQGDKEFDLENWFKQLKKNHDQNLDRIKKLEESTLVLRKNILQRRGARKTVKMDRYRLASLTSLKATIYKSLQFQRRLLSLYEPSQGPKSSA